MRILTGGDKKAFDRLGYIANEYKYFLDQLENHRDLDGKIRFVCTPNFIKSKKEEIYSTLKGFNDFYLKKII